MNNIFTFDIEDEIEQVQSQQINQYQWQPKRDSETKQKTSNSKQFTFEDFQQEQAVEVDNKNNRKIPLTQLSQNLRVQYKQREQKKKKIQLQKQHTNKNEVNQSCQFKKKQCNQIVPGLEVEDLGVKDMEYVHDKKALKVNDLRKFLYTPLGDYKVKAIIKKQEGNVFNLNVKFNVYIEQNNRYLFTISRQGISQYIFSLDKNHISEKKKSYIGKMIGNMAGTQFLLFDAGFSPNETRSLQCCRKQFASIKYSGSTGPRKFTTIISTNCQGFYALEPQQNILEQKWDKKQREYLSILYSKAPQLDPEDGNYKLDFKGIVKKASVKNFILGGVQWDDSLIFGKIDNNLFVMQIKQPLSVFQAAAISISSIHYKLSWR